MRHHQELHSLSLVEVLCLVFTSQRKPWRWHQLQWVQWRPAAPPPGCHHVLASCGELPITADITTLSPDHTTLDNITSRNHPVTRLRHSAPVTSHNVTCPQLESVTNVLRDTWSPVLTVTLDTDADNMHISSVV